MGTLTECNWLGNRACDGHAAKCPQDTEEHCAQDHQQVACAIPAPLGEQARRHPPVTKFTAAVLQASFCWVNTFSFTDSVGN